VRDYLVVDAGSPQAQCVGQILAVVASPTIRVEPAALSRRIPTQPPSRARIVITVPVIQEITLIILILRGKPQRIGSGHGPIRSQHLPKRPILIGRANRAVRRLTSAETFPFPSNATKCVPCTESVTANKPPTPPAPCIEPDKSLPQR